MWGLRRYQYWDAAARNWTDQQPTACVVPGLDPTQQKWRWRNGSPRSAADCNDNYCLYENLWCAAAGCVVWVGLDARCCWPVWIASPASTHVCAAMCTKMCPALPACPNLPARLAHCRFNNGRFYLLVDGEEGIVSPGRLGGHMRSAQPRRPGVCVMPHVLLSAHLSAPSACQTDPPNRPCLPPLPSTILCRSPGS